jgi:hypothetical protein
MGIRINKILGYGLVNLKTKEVDNYGTREIDDPRFNPEGWWNASWKDREDKWTTEGFINHCQKIVDEGERLREHFHLALMLRDDDSKSTFRDIHYCVSYENEGGLPDTIVFTPFDQVKWTRYDDTIDYYDVGGGMEPTVKVLDVPIYPYDGYIDNETGEPADEMVRHLIYMYRNAVGEDKLDLQMKALENLGCSLHWTEKYNVAIPETLVEFLRYTNMFTEDKTIWRLQPMIYSYWS